MKSIVYIFIFILGLSTSLSAQTKPDTKKPIAKNQVSKADNDVEVSLRDTSRIDSSLIVNSNAVTEVVDVRYSKDSIDATIEYNAEDSMMFDVVNNKIYLYGNADVKYKDINLTADYIIFDQANNIVTAEASVDSLGNMTGKAAFSDGNQEFTARKMKYNFKKEKGIVYDAATTQNDLYVLSGITKFERTKDDHEGHDHDGHEHEKEDIIYNKNTIITTCDHPEPHFGIRSKKQKVIANKLIVTGPANLEIGKVPTPLWLPFGFFPIKKGQRNGIVFPRDYESSQNLGFGLRNVGYYMGINENMDIQILGDVYTRGSWRLKSILRYTKMYKYRGELSLEYARINNGELPNSLEKDIQKTFAIKWGFNQNTKAHPTRTFNANVNFQLNDAQSRNYNDAQSALNNSLSSNINLTKKFRNSPMTLTTSMTHSQNTQSNRVTIQAPKARLNLPSFQPFKKKGGGKEKWFEKITMNYSSEVLGEINTVDSTLFTRASLDKFEYGFRHKARINSSQRVMRFFNFTPSINYSEDWLFKTRNKYVLERTDTTEIKEVNPADPTDTITTYTYETMYDVVTDTLNRFKALRQFDISLSLNTQIFSTLQFKKGRLKGLRYTLSPNISFNFTPDYTNDRWGYFDEYISQNGSDAPADTVRYSVFEDNIFNANPSNQGMRASINYGFSNLFEAKYLSKKDSTGVGKIIKLFDNINVAGSYNIAADSLNFSQISIGGNTRLFGGITNIRPSLIYDPYDVDDSGRRINTFYWKNNRKILRFESFRLNVTNSLEWRKIQEWLGLDKKKEGNETRNQSQDNGGGRNGNQQANYSSQFLTNISLSHRFQMVVQDGETKITANTLDIRGSINLSPKWNVNIGNIGYNFIQKRITYPDLSVSRNLHCWNMGMSWQPERGTYSFFLRVNPGSLDFISVPWQKNQFDSRGLNGRGR